MNKLELHKSQLIYIIGRPGSGKSYLSHYLISLLLNNYKYHYGFIFSPTSYDENYNKILPEQFILNVYDERILKKIIKLQIDNLKNNRNIKIFILLDDCQGTINFKSKLWIKLMSLHRHYNITLIFISQYIKYMPVLLRDICNIAFIFKLDSFFSYEGVYNVFGSSFKSINDFKLFINNNIIEKYECLIYFRKTNEYYRFICPSIEYKKCKLIMKTG